MAGSSCGWGVEAAPAAVGVRKPFGKSEQEKQVKGVGRTTAC